MHRVIILGFPLIFLFLAGVFEFERTLMGKCSEVIDGDTIIVAGERIRLKNLDAPERSQYSFDRIPIGEMSTNYLKGLIEGKKVKVRWSRRGRYGRIIGTVYFQKRNINRLILQNGYAIITKFVTDVDLISLNYIARLKRKGIFATSGFKVPYFYRRDKR